MSSGSWDLFFNPCPPGPGRSNAVAGLKVCERVPTFGDGVDIQAGDQRQASVTPVPKLAGLIAGQQPLLLLIECTQQAVELGVCCLCGVGTTPSTIRTTAVMHR